MIGISPSRRDPPLTPDKHPMILRADHRDEERWHLVIIPDLIERFTVSPNEFPADLARSAPHGCLAEIRNPIHKGGELNLFGLLKQLRHPGQKPSRRPPVNHTMIEAQGERRLGHWLKGF